jgi:ABC-2 type transport system permease protein
MNQRIIAALARKDITMFFRSRFFAFVSLLSLVTYTAIYFLMPATTSQKFEVGIYPPTLPAVVVTELERREMHVVRFDNEAELLAAVEGGEYRAGIVLPPHAEQLFEAGERMRITAYYPPGIPAELNRAFNDLLALVFNEISYVANDQPLLIERHEAVLGYDLAGKQIAPRDRMLPLFAMLLLMMETLGLANLVTEEIERGTARALLATPMRLGDFLIGKSIAGILLAFGQAALLIGITGKLGWQPLLIIVVLGLGAVLVTGVGFLIAALSQDLMSVISWGMLVIILLGLPSVSVMFPGTISGWVRVIPSFYLVDTLHRIINFNADWQSVAGNLVTLMVAGFVVLSAGTFALGRKLS